jgi:uncharacterized membrane protein YwzB
MSTLNVLARQAGAIYLVFSLVAIVGEFVIPSAMVSGDPAATARNITSAETLYRVDLLIGFVTLLLFAFLVVSLHRLFRDVDRSQAMLMVVLVSIGIAVSLANMLHKFTPLVLPGSFLGCSAFCCSSPGSPTWRAASRRSRYRSTDRRSRAR